MNLQKEKEKISQILKDKAFVYKGTKFALDENRWHSDNPVLKHACLMKLFTPGISTFFWSHAVEALPESPVPFKVESVEESPAPEPVAEKKPKPTKKKKQPK